jgi:hypothetical protein
MGDGAVKTVSKSISTTVFSQSLTRGGNETMDESLFQ